MDDKNENWWDKCKCGSGETPREVYDGFDIFMGRCCSKCGDHLLKGFRKDIFERYDCDEPIEPEDY
jgi:hypothetical protein